MLKPTLRSALIVSITVAFVGGWFCGRRSNDQVAPVSPAKQYLRFSLQQVDNETAAPTPAEITPAPSGVIPPPPSAFNSILKLNARRDRESALQALGSSLAATNLTEAIRLASEIGDHLDREAFLTGVVKVWAAKDPDAALAYCLNQTFSLRCNLVPLVFAELARSSPDSALDALAGLPQGEVHDKATEAIFTTWSAINPTAAARRLSVVKEEALRERIVDSFAGEWAANDPPAALAWAMGLEQTEDKTAAMSSALREFGRRYPAESLQWATDQMRSTSPLPGEALASLLAEAGFGAPREAFQRGLTYGNDPRVIQSLAAVTSYYAEDHARGLLDDFRRLTQGQQEKNSAAVLFALGAASATVPADLFSSFTNPEVTRESVNAYVQGLSLRDASRAEAWVRTLPAGPIRTAAQSSLEQPKGNAAGIVVTAPAPAQP